MKHNAMCAVLMLALTGGFAAAGDIPCKPDGNQHELNQCALDAYTASDKKLNTTWKALLKKYKNADSLKVSQRAWIVFRDAEVAAMFACEDNDMSLCWGSMYPMLYHYALQDLTDERTKRLQRYLDEGLNPAVGE